MSCSFFHCLRPASFCFSRTIRCERQVNSGAMRRNAPSTSQPQRSFTDRPVLPSLSVQLGKTRPLFNKFYIDQSSPQKSHILNTTQRMFIYYVTNVYILYLQCRSCPRTRQDQNRRPYGKQMCFCEHKKHHTCPTDTKPEQQALCPVASRRQLKSSPAPAVARMRGRTVRARIYPLPLGESSRIGYLNHSLAGLAG